MNITKDTVVTLTFRASDASGKLLEDGKTPRSYLHGGYGNTLPGIEAALEGQAAGYQTTVKLAPADAFGERDESLVTTIPKKDFPPGVKATIPYDSSKFVEISIRQVAMRPPADRVQSDGAPGATLALDW